MSGLELKWILGAVAFTPLIFSPLLLISWRFERTRNLLVGSYAFLIVLLNSLLLYGFLENNSRGFALFWMRAASFPVALVAFTCFLSAAVLLWLGFKKSSGEVPPLLFPCISFSTGLVSMAYLSVDILPYTAFWIGISILAFIGFIAHRQGSLRKALYLFAPWFTADALLVAGVVLSIAWLGENKVLIEAPLKSGSEIQVVLIMILFLASCFIRLGVFPFNTFTGALFAGSDADWSAFFMGIINFLLVGSRLIITACLIARFVATDWSFVITAIGLVSVVAGPVQAIRARTATSFLACMYLFLVSFLVTGIGLFSRTGWEGAMYCLLTAPVLLTGAAIALDRICEIRGTNELGVRTISPKNAPVAFLVLLFSALAMAGFPPSSGFLCKAVVTLGGIDKAATHGFNSLVYVFAPVGCALAFIAVIRVVSIIFGAGRGYAGKATGRSTFVEGFIPLALCGFSYFVGIFPGGVFNNLVVKSSRSLIPAGFSGPGVAFHGIGSKGMAIFDYFKSWAMDPVSFLTAVSVVVVTLYFINRASNPSDGPAARFQPFEGGMSADCGFGCPVAGTGNGTAVEKEKEGI